MRSSRASGFCARGVAALWAIFSIAALPTAPPIDGVERLLGGLYLLAASDLIFTACLQIRHTARHRPWHAAMLCRVPCSPRGDADRTHRATRPGLAAAPDELQLADQDGPVADDMGDGLHEHRSPRPAELDAWARARSAVSHTSAATKYGRPGGRQGAAVGDYRAAPNGPAYAPEDYQ